MPVHRLLSRFIRRVTGASLSLMAAASLAGPALQQPRIVDGDQPIRVLATVPREPVVIEGFKGRVDGLMLYGINGETPTLRPATWRTEPGRSLAFTLINDLPCAAPEAGKHMRADQTNLHVHGLLVHPNSKDALGQYGDHSMLVLESGRRASSGRGGGPCARPGRPDSNDPHARESGQAGFRVSLPASHPYGMSWYHPHVHEVAGAQVGAGMSGLISVGDIWSTAYARYSALTGTAADQAQVPESDRIGQDPQRAEEERALRRQTQQVHLMLKDLQLAAIPGRANAYRYNPSFTPDLCGGQARAPQAWCRAGKGGGVWLFTVNGQLQPELQIGRGQRQVWRIANVSGTVSYELQLRITAPRQHAGQVVPLQVVGGDGVAFHQSKAQANYQHEMMLLPSARVDVHVDPLHVCRVLQRLPDRPGTPCTMPGIEAVLETAGPNLGADQWPQADLMRVRIESIDTYRSEHDPGPLGVSVRQAPQARAAATPVPVEPPCSNGPTRITEGQYRLIGLRNDMVAGKERFGMAVSGPHALVGGQPAVIDLPRKAYRAFDPSRIDLCIHADLARGYEERWVVRNDSDEVHNFHLHQARFEVLDHRDGPRPLHAGKASGAGIWHDNFPINPGGWILLRVRFDQPEQAGRYMYHCHILEHEDKGMMAMIQVVDTARRPSQAQAAQRFPGAGSRAPGLSDAQASRPAGSPGDAFARYLASAPPWMSQALCRTEPVMADVLSRR